MPYKEKIIKTAANFPGLLNSDRLNLLNSQLIELQKKGFTKLIGNFLSNKTQYSIRPFLFEIYICRWLLSLNQCKDIVYEPDSIDKPPEFIFNIDDKSFQIEAKTITQVINETVKKKLVSQINRQISSRTNNVIEIWLSENIEPKDINKIVAWIAVECISLDVGNKREYITDGETLAWINTTYQSNNGGSVGIEHILGTANGLMQQVDVDKMRDKILSKIKRSNNKFRSQNNKNVYNLLFITCDTDIFLTKETFQEALYGSEAVINFPDKNGKMQFKEILQDNGIWSKINYMNIDIVMFIKPGTDLIKNDFDPYVFPNPHKHTKLREIPKPFRDMKPDYPPNLLRRSIFGY